MRGNRFMSNDKDIAAVDEFFSGLLVDRYRDGIHKFKEHLNKCIEHL